MAGAVLMLAAVVPAFTAGAALAADAPEVTPTASATATSTETAYADEVGIGTALKIAAPGIAAPAADPVTTTTLEPLPDDPNAEEKSSASAAPVEDPDATPSDAEVIETDSIQNATEDPTEVAVLGTKIGGNQLAETGPGQVGVQALVALALVALGLAMFTGPSLWTAAASRRH